MRKTYSIKMTYSSGVVAYMSVNGKTEWSKKSYCQRHIDSSVFLHNLKMEIVENWK